MQVKRYAFLERNIIIRAKESSSWILFWNWFLNLVKDERNKSSDGERGVTDLKQWQIEEWNLDG